MMNKTFTFNDKELKAIGWSIFSRRLERELYRNELLKQNEIRIAENVLNDIVILDNLLNKFKYWLS